VLSGLTKKAIMHAHASYQRTSAEKKRPLCATQHHARLSRSRGLPLRSSGRLRGDRGSGDELFLYLRWYPINLEYYRYRA